MQFPPIPWMELLGGVLLFLGGLFTDPKKAGKGVRGIFTRRD